MAHVLVVDDEPRIRSYLNRSLSGQGHRVYEAADGRQALVELELREVDLVLLDLAMPGLDGLGVLGALEQRGSSPPIIVLSAVTDVSTRVQALDHGAIDVITKPFSAAELSARIRRHLQGGAPPPPTERRYLRRGGVELDLDRRRVVTAQGTEILTEREVALLAHLMRRSGDVCSREELLRDVWGLDFDPSSNVVDVYLRRLRAKLQPDPPIETVRGVGYCFYDH
jgi:DNA-binding response OmpR family regulator